MDGEHRVMGWVKKRWMGEMLRWVGRWLDNGEMDVKRREMG